MQYRLIKLLLFPSLLSGTCTFVAAFAVLGYSGWSYISQNELFYDLFFGAYGVETLLWEWSNSESAWQQAFLHSPTVYYIFIAGSAVVAGLITYTVLEGARALLRQTSDALHTFSRETWTHLGIRVISIIGWMIYFSFFVSTIFPSTLLLTEIGVDILTTNAGNALLHWLAAFSLFVVAVHMHVIFLRLCLLRPRIFGGWGVEKAAIAADH